MGATGLELNFGEEAFTAARKAGQALSLEETIGEALALADTVVGVQT
jgi:hypothetical protein